MKLIRLAFSVNMSLLTRLGCLAIALMSSWNAIAVSPNVVISQAYGGGGNSGSVYKNDFIELFNRSSSPVSLSGWSVQYASSTGSSWATTALTGTIQPYSYYLVQEAVGAGGTTALPTPDATGTISMSGTAFKVAVCNSTVALSGTTPSGATLVDFVGAGAANGFEGAAAAPAPSNANSVMRANNGCTDTDNNGSDFAAVAANPRNSAAAANNCGGGLTGFIRVETKADGTGTIVPAQTLSSGNSITVYAISRDASTNFVANVAADSWVVSKSGTVVATDLVPAGDLKSAVFTAHGSGTAVITANSSTANSVSSGTITVTAGAPTQVQVETAADGSGTIVPAQTVVTGHSVTMFAIRRDAYTNFVDNIAASTWTLPVITGAVANTDLLPSADKKSATFIGNGQGTATVRATSAALASVDSGLLTITQLPPSTVVISQVYGGGGNTGAPAASYQSDFVELFNRSANPVSLNGWSIQYASSTGAFGSSTVAALPSVSIPGYSYYLVQLFTTNTSGVALPAPDFVATNINMSATAGKIALANTTAALGTVTWPDARVLDLVGYGGANLFEGTGTATSPGNNNSSAVRNNNGCTDTDDNASDFAVLSPPNPRNSGTTQNICSSQTPPTISAIANQAVDASAPIGPVTFTVNDQQTPAANLLVTAVSSNPTLLPNNQITFGGNGIVRNVSLNPVSGQTGTAQITVTVTDTDNMTASSSFYLFVGAGPQVGMLFYDDFSAYADGTSLSFVGDANNTGWRKHDTAAGVYQLVVSNQQAQVCLTITNSEDVSAPLTNSLGGSNVVTTSSGTILYVGCKVTQTVLPTANGEYFMHLKDGTSSNFVCRLFASTVNAATGKFRLGLSNKSATPPNVQFPTDLDLGTTYNVVMRYKVGVGVSTLWVNPTSINDSSVTATDAVSPAIDVAAIAFRETGSGSSSAAAGSQAVDNLAVSTSFSDVVALTPLPPAIAAVRSGNAVQLSWPTANNSAFVLQSASTVNSVSWATVNGVAVSGSNYTVTVPFTSTPAFFRLKK
jgi:hypothetical protein